MEQSSTAMEGLNTIATQEQLQHPFHVTEISGKDKLQELAAQLGKERIMLLLQIFGKHTQEQQNILF